MTEKAAHALVGAPLSLWAGAALAEWRLGLQDPKTALGHAVYDLHSIISLICLAIFVAVFGAMFYAIWKHRRAVGHQAAQFHEHTAVEVIWTVIPFVILLVMAWPATKTLLEQRDASAPASAGSAEGRAIYDRICQACHASGLAGAPKTGDKVVWAPRIARGEALLVEHAIKGIRTMPPKGGNPDLSEEQVKAAVAYMAARSK